MKSISSKSRLGGLALALFVLFGVGMVSNASAQDQGSWERDRQQRRDRDQENRRNRDSNRNNGDWNRDNRDRNRDNDDWNRGIQLILLWSSLNRYHSGIPTLSLT